MQRVDEEFIFILVGSCFCAFLFVVIVGGAFLFIRIRQQERSGVPAPEPPVMTRDVHAEPLSEFPSALDPVAEPTPPEVEPMRDEDEEVETPYPDQDTLPSDPPSESSAPQAESIADLETLSPTPALTPLGTEETLLGVDDDDETRVLAKRPQTSNPERKTRPPPLTPITLPDMNDEDNTTVIVDRSKPFEPEDE